MTKKSNQTPSEPAQETNAGVTPVEASALAQALESTVDAPQEPVKVPEIGARVLVSVAQGTMTHLFTNQVVTQTPSLMEVDSFAQAQIEARKWAFIAL